MDVTENSPSLINCLETGQNGLYLDLDLPSGGHGEKTGACIGIGPFSKTIPACIKTDGNDVLKRVLLVRQRDDYDTPGSLTPVNNLGIETAWQNAFAFHRNGGPAKAPILFKHQVSPTGEFRPLQPLFCCNETRRWFHPVCPQCGLALALCRDDALLKISGLPTFSASMQRFLYCGSCTTRSSDSPAFYLRDKVSGMPDIVYDSGDLVTQWKRLLEKFPDGAELPCLGCPEKDVCYGPESLVSRRIVPFSFFPFFLMMFPAPTCFAADFLPLISGGTLDIPRGADNAVSLFGKSRFLFQDQDRQFLEILYLKLTFLAQLYRQLMPADDSPSPLAFTLSLEGIGVDLNPAGAGLPAYWNFNVCILDAVGSVQISPFAPIMPEAPRLHFLGAVWFRTLLVNSRQPADMVYAEVGRRLEKRAIEKGAAARQIEPSDLVGVFAGSQIFWDAGQHRLAEHWHDYWRQAIHLGFQLVHAGVKARGSWDPGRFGSTLDALRDQIKDEMFTASGTASADKDKIPPSDTIRKVPHEILKATDVPAAPAADSDWESDIQETVIFSSADSVPPSESAPKDLPESHLQDSQWNDDIEETVVLRTNATKPSGSAASSADDMDQTVVIKAPSGPWEPPPAGKEADLGATVIQDAPSPSPPSPAGPDEDW